MDLFNSFSSFDLSSFDLAPTPSTVLMETVTKVTKNIPVVANAALFGDNICTAGQASVNFYYCVNPVARVCFGASIILGTTGGICSASSLIGSALGIPVFGVVGSFGSRAFNKLGKYTYCAGKIANGSLVNITELRNTTGLPNVNELIKLLN